jgi:NADH oxidase (H2O-forming)
MKTVLVLYYSRSGNTEKMAQAVAEGAKRVGEVDVELRYHVEAQELGSFDGIIIGVPTYHHALPIDVTNLFEDAGAQGIVLKHKAGAVFGSYGWSGEAPKLILEIMKLRFEMNVLEPPLLIKYAPDQNAIMACRDLGKMISETLMNKAKH